MILHIMKEAKTLLSVQEGCYSEALNKSPDDSTVFVHTQGLLTDSQLVFSGV